jgi:hypothetical protein
VPVEQLASSRAHRLFEQQTQPPEQGQSRASSATGETHAAANTASAPAMAMAKVNGEQRRTDLILGI